MDFDLTNLNDEDLDALRVDVLTEQERRANIAQIPEQVAGLSRTYRDGGGDPAVLERAVAGEGDSDDAELSAG